MKDPARTTPSPQPVDLLMRAGRLARKAHDSLPGIWVSSLGHGVVWAGQAKAAADAAAATSKR
jgi:hypothetical protein